MRVYVYMRVYIRQLQSGNELKAEWDGTPRRTKENIVGRCHGKYRDKIGIFEWKRVFKGQEIWRDMPMAKISNRTYLMPKDEEYDIIQQAK